MEYKLSEQELKDLMHRTWLKAKKFYSGKEDEYFYDYFESEKKQLTIYDVVASLPTYKETKIECKKQLKEMNESYALGTLRSYEKRFFTSGFIRCYLFMKGKR